jgi:hypothetical protein
MIHHPRLLCASLVFRWDVKPGGSRGKMGTRLSYEQVGCGMGDEGSAVVE